MGVRFLVEKSNNNIAGLIFNGGDTGGIHLRLCTADSAGTIVKIVITGRGITNAEARGIFDNNPGEHQPREFNHTQDEHEQER